ncbi:hypothetical protein Pcinc_034880 [Petrolisthes cinctipes]|nr:hypothetical protein Pcinc_034880 [Petrolisthes cinctipes]
MTFREFSEHHTNALGPSMTLQHYSTDEMDRLVYFEPSLAENAAIIARLSDAGPVLVDQVINVWFEKLPLIKTSSVEASGSLSAVGQVSSVAASEGLRIASRLDENRVLKAVKAILKLSVLRRSRLLIPIDYYNADLLSFLTSLLILALFSR